MKHCKLSALLLAFALLFSLAACETGVDAPTGGPTQQATASVSPTEGPSNGPAETPDCPMPHGPVRVAVLSGPTGVGAAKLLSDADNDPSALRAGYDCHIYTDNSELVAGLTTGELDIATMASNMAANLYNKTNGDVTIIAAGTLGVLHILEGGGGNSIRSIADLQGKTIWAAGKGANPEYILRYLLEQNDLTPGKNVEVQFADAGEIQAKLLAGQIQYAMLPVPAATAAIAKGEGKVRAAIDVTEAWNELQGGSPLVMTAVVARTEFVGAYPELVNAFLADYKDSIDYVNHNDAAAKLVADYGLAPSEAIARQAIPQCHLVFLSGEEMLSALADYFHVLWSIDHDAVGGSVPSDRIYYIQ